MDIGLSTVVLHLKDAGVLEGRFSRYSVPEPSEFQEISDVGLGVIVRCVCSSLLVLLGSVFFYVFLVPNPDVDLEF